MNWMQILYAEIYFYFSYLLVVYVTSGVCEMIRRVLKSLFWCDYVELSSPPKKQ